MEEKVRVHGLPGICERIVRVLICCCLVEWPMEMKDVQEFLNGAKIDEVFVVFKHFNSVQFEMF